MQDIGCTHSPGSLQNSGVSVFFFNLFGDLFDSLCEREVSRVNQPSLKLSRKQTTISYNN